MSVGARGAHTMPRGGVAASWLFSIPHLDSVSVTKKIGTLAFVSSNFNNISRTTFLKYKNSGKQELALWHLVTCLVPKNA
jgi:hypothetical protein